MLGAAQGWPYRGTAERISIAFNLTLISPVEDCPAGAARKRWQKATVQPVGTRRRLLRGHRATFMFGG